ncbi:MAG: rod shape-determining protein MreD [Candidatus Krumholzibacteriota bacterium]|nr:rod shape-determining protein MreD [Candidatus Krumholzibacteriota bacterium]
MYFVRTLIAACVVFVLQLTVVHRIAVGGASPDMMLILLVVLVLDRKPVAAVIIGFLLGYLQDLGNASFLGMNALAKSLVGYCIARFGGDYLPDNVIFRGVLIFSACLINDLVVLNISSSFNPFDVLTSFFRYSLISALYTVVVGILILKLLHLLPRRMVRQGGSY